MCISVFECTQPNHFAVEGLICEFASCSSIRLCVYVFCPISLYLALYLQLPLCPPAIYRDVMFHVLDVFHLVVLRVCLSLICVSIIHVHINCNYATILCNRPRIEREH